MSDQGITVELVYALPERCWRRSLALPVHATVALALAEASEWLAEHLPPSALDPQRLAVFGQKVELDTPLHDGDRIELLRPLLADPKQARRQRALSQPRRSSKKG